MERMDILVVEERDNSKPWFTKVGTAFPNRNGTGYTLVFPPGVSVGGRAIMKPAERREQKGDAYEGGYGGDDRPPWE